MASAVVLVLQLTTVLSVLKEKQAKRKRTLCQSMQNGKGPPGRQSKLFPTRAIQRVTQYYHTAPDQRVR